MNPFDENELMPEEISELSDEGLENVGGGADFPSPRIPFADDGDYTVEYSREWDNDPAVDEPIDVGDYSAVFTPRNDGNGIR